MLFPKIEAKILQSVQIKPYENVLEIGTGSGYMTALLAHLAKQVTSVELHESLSQQAQEKLTLEGFDNISLSVADAAQGFQQDTSFDIIVITGSVPQLPESYKNSLAKNGRLFAVIGTAPVMEATLITRTSDTHFSTEVLFETQIPALENVSQNRTFTL